MDFAKLLQAILNGLAALFGKKQDPPPTPPDPVGQVPAPVNRNILLVIYNPRVPAEQNRKLTDVLGWNDPDALVASFIADLRQCSHGYANFAVADRVEVDRLPVKQDGFVYSPDQFVSCFRSDSGFHSPDEADYSRILSDFNIVARINSGSIDEVWLIAPPYAGFAESRMAGPGAFFCNGAPLPNVFTNRRFIIMGFNYQRGIGEMFESMAHRAESIIAEVFRSTSGESNLWQRFNRYNLTSPGAAEVGSVHYAPNSQTDYDWGNITLVPTRCRNWNNFPDLSGNPVLLNCSEWGGGDIRLHHMWWLGLFPHISGENGGISYNWWMYLTDPNKVR